MLFGSLRVTMKRQVSLPLWRERVIHVTHDEVSELFIMFLVATDPQTFIVKFVFFIDS